jgi:hypothetical protein
VTNEVKGQELDLVSVSEKPPVWAGKEIRQFHNLSDIRREQSAVYWLWRRHGVLTVAEAATAIQALACIKATMEAERDCRLAELEADFRELKAELERDAMRSVARRLG